MRSPAAPLRSKVRLAVVTAIPTPYRDPFWNELARLPEIDLTVYYCSAGKADRPWKDDWRRDYECKILPGRNLLAWRGPDASCFWNPGIVRSLAGGNFDAVIVGGYNHLTMWATMLLCVWRKIPFYLMSESHLRCRRSRWKSWFKRPFLRWIVSHAAGMLPTGALAAEFLATYGACPSRMTLVPNVPDLERLRHDAARLREENEFPGPPGFAGRPLALFVGRLIPKKRAELLIRALHGMQGGAEAVLVIVGDGPQRKELERLVENLGLQSRVHFAGFVQPDEVLRWYAFARVMVVPSSETWSVAVLEALAAGVPVVVSDEVGCCVDVINDPAVGTIVRAGDRDSLTQALEQRLARPADRTLVEQAWEPVRQTLCYSAVARNLADTVCGLPAARSQLPELVHESR